MSGFFDDVAETTDLSRLKSILGSVDVVDDVGGGVGGGGGCDEPPQRFGGGTGGGGTKDGGVAGLPDCLLKISSSNFCIRCSAIF